MYTASMSYERKDHFYRKAKREGKVSRAAYKIEELNQRFGIIKKNDVVLDLGAAPGGWLKETSRFVGERGRVIGIDLLPIKTHLPPNCAFILGDLSETGSQKKLADFVKGKVDVVLSDMSPNLSGVAFADAYRSYELALLAFEICKILLREGGNFVLKIFPGNEFSEYMKILRKNFFEATVVVPKSTRKTSSERYVVAKKFKTQ